MRSELRFPILRSSHLNRFFSEIELTLEIRTGKYHWQVVPFLFDTGTQLTTISFNMAQDLDIPWNQKQQVQIQGATGKSQGNLGPLWFSFSALPQLQFQTVCCFTPHRLRRPLVSLSDIINQFTLRTVLPSKLHPLGSIVLRLHQNNRGEPRVTM
jgi:hypothetical protein